MNIVGMNKVVIVVLLLSGIVAQASLPVVKIGNTQGHVSFLAVGKPSFLKIKGEASGPVGQIEKKADGSWIGRFEFDLKGLETGIGLRDTHMKERYLEVEKYPRAILTISKIDLPLQWTPTTKYSGDLPFVGEMGMRGVKKPVKGTAKIVSDAAGTDVTTKVELKISDFKIELPKYAGITVADTVEIEVTLNKVK